MYVKVGALLSTAKNLPIPVGGVSARIFWREAARTCGKTRCRINVSFDMLLSFASKKLEREQKDTPLPLVTPYVAVPLLEGRQTFGK